MVTVEEFIGRIEGYYGEYRPAVKPVVVQWIRSQRAGSQELTRLFAELVKTHTSQYRTPPDVAIMRPLLLDIQEESEQHRLADLTRPMLPDASEVVDSVTQEAFWAAFNGAIRDGRDPAADAELRAILERLGVLGQVQSDSA